MNKRGFAISIILYSMVFLLVSIFYILLGIVKTRYNITSGLRNNIIDDLNETNVLYDIIENLGNTTSINYVLKYDVSNGAPIDTVDGSGNKDIYYYTSNNSNDLAGKNGNVVFGDYCWQIVRTTATGGVKLIYNGPKTSDDKCPKTRSAIEGFIGTDGKKEVTMTGSKIYAESFKIINDGGTKKFKLLHTNSYSWSDATHQNIVGKFVCGDSSSPTGSSDTCTVLWYVGTYRSDTKASVSKYEIGTNEHYSIIGKSSYNLYYDNPVTVGYMYNDGYIVDGKSLYTPENIITSHIENDSLYYGTKAVWNSSTNKYDLKVDDGNGNDITPTTTYSWSDIYNTAQGMYTCRNYPVVSSCSTVYYIIAADNRSKTVFTLSNGETINNRKVDVTYGTGFTENNGTYTLTGTSATSVLLKDWYTNYDTLPFKNKYVCSDLTSTTCSGGMYYIHSTHNQGYSYFTTNKNYIYGNSVTYVNGNYIINNDSDPTKYHRVWNWYLDYTNMSKSHYTCFKTDTNDCGSSVYYVYYGDSTGLIYIELKNGENIEDALQNMFNANNNSNSTINRYNSAAKAVIDSWYEQNLLNLTNYLDDNEVYCNDRTISFLGGWNPNNSIATDHMLKFTSYNKPAFDAAKLTCASTTDRFSVNNSLAKLKYPVGLLSDAERALMQKDYLKTGKVFMTGTPTSFDPRYGIISTVNSNGDATRSSNLNTPSGVRPVITLKAGTEVTGTGTYTNPYVVDTSARSDIEMRSITITANRQEIDYGLQIASSTKRVSVTATYSGEEALRAGDRLQSIKLTQSTNQVVTNGTITPSDAVIVDADGNDVTKLYSITYNEGQLVILDNVITGDPYTVEYYLGNGTSTDGAVKLGSKTCIFSHPCSLDTFESFNVIFPYSSESATDRGWVFYGWTDSNSGTNKLYDNGDSINPSTYKSTLTLYALGRKSYRFNSGIEPKSYTTKYQYWNPVNIDENHRTAIAIPTPKDLSASSDGSWTFVGYVGGSNYAGGTDVHFGASLAGTNYNPVIDTGATGLMRSKYKRTLTVHYNGNSGSGTMTDSTLTQVYNSGAGSADGTTNSGSTLGSYAITLKNNGYTKTDYLFKNWTENSTSGTAYVAGASYNKLGSTIKSTTLTSTMYASWLKSSYDITFQYHESGNYADDEYLNTGYKINWGRSFSIGITFQYTTTGVRHLIIGNYGSANAKNLNIEINTDNKLRLYMGDGAVDKTSASTIPTGNSIRVKFTWNASTKAYSLSATNSSDVNLFDPITGTKSMSGTAPNTLWTNRDHRGTGTFKKIKVTRVVITDTRATNSTLSDLPSMSKSGMTYKGWYTAETGGTKITTSKTVTANATYHAQWKTWTKKTYNCTKGTWSSSPTETRVQTCTARTKSSADSNNYSTYWTCEQIGIAGAAHSICEGAGLVAPCYRKATYSRTGCSTYSSTATTTTGVTSCTATTSSTEKITCTEE